MRALLASWCDLCDRPVYPAQDIVPRRHGWAHQTCVRTDDE